MIATLFSQQNWKSNTAFTVNPDLLDTKCLMHLLNTIKAFNFIFSITIKETGLSYNQNSTKDNIKMQQLINH